MINIKMGDSGVTFNCIVSEAGGQYCVMIKGTCLYNNPAGLGNTIMDAIENFKDKVRNNQVRGKASE